MINDIFLAQRLSIFSQFFHFIGYKLKKAKKQFENGLCIVSVDVDVGNKEVGVINKGKNDVNVNRYYSEYFIGKIEEQALPLFINFFNELEIPVTFAMRGQLIEVDSTLFDRILEAPIHHEIGSHSYYHRDFTTLSHKEAEYELRKISVAMKEFDITPKSFVFPKNNVAHLDLLEKYGYKCYRGRGDLWEDCMFIEKQNRLYNIHPSFFLGQCVAPLFLKKIVDISIESRLPFHVWFHLWDFGITLTSTQKGIKRVLYPLFRYIKEKEEEGILTCETMLSAANKAEKIFPGH